jgi:hypothetical protein
MFHPDLIFQAQNEHEKELMKRISERDQVNFESAKRNFMENYENMCKAMGLEVVWTKPELTGDTLIPPAN